MHTTELYFECHITFEPVFDGRLEEAQKLCRLFGFRVADLLMRKRVADTPERSQYDTFCTSRSTSYDDLVDRMTDCVALLQTVGFRVWRFKIENTLLDIRLAQ